MGSANYHSLQSTLQRRFGRDITFSMAYTWSKAMATANGDGSNTNPVCSRCYDYQLAAFDRTHNLSLNYVWNLPGVSRFTGGHWLARGVLDNWQLSGISIFQTGSPAELNPGIPDVNVNQRIAGSWTEQPRMYLTADPQGKPSTRANWFDYTAFRLPDVGDVGPWPRTYMRNPGMNVHDLSIYKNFPLWSEKDRFLQFRLEMFNAFNHPQFTGFQGGMSFNIKKDFSDYAANQQASLSSLRNLRGGTNSPATGRLGRATGEVNGQPGFVAANRVIQMALKLYF